MIFTLSLGCWQSEMRPACKASRFSSVGLMPITFFSRNYVYCSIHVWWARHVHLHSTTSTFLLKTPEWKRRYVHSQLVIHKTLFKSRRKTKKTRTNNLDDVNYTMFTFSERKLRWSANSLEPADRCTTHSVDNGDTVSHPTYSVVHFGHQTFFCFQLVTQLLF